MTRQYLTKIKASSGRQKDLRSERNSSNEDVEKWIVIQYVDDSVLEIRRAPRKKNNLTINNISKWKWKNGTYYDAKIIFIGSKENAKGVFAEMKNDDPRKVSGSFTSQIKSRVEDTKMQTSIEKGPEHLLEKRNLKKRRDMQKSDKGTAHGNGKKSRLTTKLLKKKRQLSENINESETSNKSFDATGELHSQLMVKDKGIDDFLILKKHPQCNEESKSNYEKTAKLKIKQFNKFQILRNNDESLLFEKKEENVTLKEQHISENEIDPKREGMMCIEKTAEHLVQTQTEEMTDSIVPINRALVNNIQILESEENEEIIQFKESHRTEKNITLQTRKLDNKETGEEYFIHKEKQIEEINNSVLSINEKLVDYSHILESFLEPEVKEGNMQIKEQHATKKCIESQTEEMVDMGKGGENFVLSENNTRNVIDIVVSIDKRVVNYSEILESTLESEEKEETTQLNKKHITERKKDTDKDKEIFVHEENEIKELSHSVLSINNKLVDYSDTSTSNSSPENFICRKRKKNISQVIFDSNSEYFPSDSSFEEQEESSLKKCSFNTSSNNVNLEDSYNSCFQSKKDNNTYSSSSNFETSNENLTTEDNANETMVVCTTNNIGRRKWDKKNFCIFCDKIISNLYKHLIYKHNKESQVSKILSMRKGTAERREMLRKLRNAGNYKYNASTLQKGTGYIIPSKRPSAKIRSNIDEYRSCDNCLGVYKKNQMWRHKKKCCNGRTLPQGRKKTAPISYAFEQVHVDCTKELKENIFPQMMCDEVTLAAKNDSLILAYGARLYKKNGKEKHQHAYIRNKLREIGRFLITLRTIDDKLDLNTAIDPKNFENIIKAVHILGEFDEENGIFQKPSLVLKLGHALKHCANIKKSKSIVEQNEHMRKCADDFIQVCSFRWPTEISGDALSTLYKRKWNNPPILPLAEDIQKLQIYLNEKLKDLCRKLSKSVSKTDWEELCRVTLAIVILFNRRRAGEAQRLEIKTYENRDTTACQEEVLKSLTDFEKKLVETLTLIETRGKRGKKVAILLKDEMKTAIDILIKNRKIAGVDERNLYIFARTNFNSLDCQRANDVIKRVAKEAGLKQPDLISSTKLRKHIATMSQLFNLKENELETLAAFLGHNIKIHRDFYRLPEKTMILAKVSKILIAAEQGKMHTYKGKSLDDISEQQMFVSGDEESEESDSEESVLSDYSSKETEKMQVEGKRNTCKNGMKMFDTINKNENKNENLRKIPKNPWSEDEVAAVKTHLSKFFYLKTIPGKKDCEDCLKKSGTKLQNRNWKQIKYFVYNRVKKDCK